MKRPSRLLCLQKITPKQPYIVNIYPSGKCECDRNCPGYVAESICAHVIAACLKTSRLSNFSQWFVTKKRKSGGINYCRAVSFGMPRGRGRKGEAPPRERKKRSEPTVSVDRNLSMQHHSTTTVQPNLCSSEGNSSFSPAGHTSLHVLYLFVRNTRRQQLTHSLFTRCIFVLHFFMLWVWKIIKAVWFN